MSGRDEEIELADETQENIEEDVAERIEIYFGASLQPEARIFLVETTRYLLSELLKEAGNDAHHNQKKQINPPNLKMALRYDAEMSRLFINLAISRRTSRLIRVFKKKKALARKAHQTRHQKVHQRFHQVQQRDVDGSPFAGSFFAHSD